CARACGTGDAWSTSTGARRSASSGHTGEAVHKHFSSP
ncbi:MAG: hypothetical protein AVDCRST_MAG07-881, partial [uncultured Frankineae bacterium]